MISEEDQDVEVSELADFLGKLLDIEVNYPVLEKKAEHYFNPKLATLAEDNHIADRLGETTRNLVITLGGMSEQFLINTENSKTKDFIDTFPNSVMSEILASFWKARRSIGSSHITFIAEQLFTMQPDLIATTEDERGLVVPLLTRRYWEQIEYAYIRLTSYWDRVGQLLNYVFFNIREYENDTFSTVMRKIHTNMVPCYSSIKESVAYINLWHYSESKKEDGLGWILKRRNILIHKLGFTLPTIDMQGKYITINDSLNYHILYNHLQDIGNRKLRQDDQYIELKRIHQQLNTICMLFSDVLSLAQLGADMIPRPMTKYNNC